MHKAFDAPWKIWNEASRWLILPYIRLLLALNGIAWGQGWRFYGAPVIQKHRHSLICMGRGLGLRSSMRSNPLGPTHPVILCTWKAGAVLEIGANFRMTGGSLVAAERITIGDNVAVGANTVIIDTDFHPLIPHERILHPQDSVTAPVTVEDHAFIGMNCLVLKGVTIGRGCVIGAGSVVTKNTPAGTIVAGNPARVIGALE